MIKTHTFKDYKLAIKEHFINAKEKDASGILANPSPAQMRNFCLFLCNKEIRKKDEEVFRLLFETKDGEDLKKSIERCNIDKFKSIISFLKGEKDSENSIRIEMAAIIVDFDKRPYKVFSNEAAYGSRSLEEKNEAHSIPPNETLMPTLGLTKINSEIEETGLNPTPKKEWFFWFKMKKRNILLAFIVFLVTGFAAAKWMFKEKECMQWNKDHYVVVDCLNDKQQNHLMNTIMPVNEELLNFKKIEVSDTTTFFRHDKPQVWYCKVEGKPVFFNSIGTGFHPEHGKTLKPVSQFIVNKYVLGVN